MANAAINDEPRLTHTQNALIFIIINYCDTHKKNEEKKF